MSIQKKLITASLSVIIPAAIVAPLTLSAEGNPYYGGWSNCTWSAWELAAAAGYILPSWGNAGAWYGNAAAQGYSVGSYPAANSIVVYSGHVGYVSAVDGDMIYVQEGGFSGGYHEGWWNGTTGRSQALIGYIYLDGSDYSGYVSYSSIVESATQTVSGITENVPQKKIESAITYSENAQETIDNEQSTVVFEDIIEDTVKDAESKVAQEYNEEVLKSKIIK